MSVMKRIAELIPVGSRLNTPSGSSEFEITELSSKRIIVTVGERNTRIAIPGSCFENSVAFLKGKDWVRIGAIHSFSYPGSFDAYIKDFTKGVSAASYVSPILEKAGIVQINPIRPAKIKLKLSD